MKVIGSVLNRYEKPTAVALGFFDGVHMGHRAVLAPALAQKQRGLTPACFSFLLPSKQDSRLNTETEKQALLEQMGIEVLFCPSYKDIWGMSPEAFVTDILAGVFHAQFVSCGYDFTFGKDKSGDVSLLQKLCQNQGIQVQVVPKVCLGDISVHSTVIRQLLKEGDVSMAGELLTYPYQIQGEILHGNALGRTIGFPTINVIPPSCKIVPKLGVYISSTMVDGVTYASVSNVGIKPTVGGTTLLCETHLLDFTQDAYGKSATTYLHRFVRDEQKFASVDQLKEQIDQAVLAAKNFYEI